jgi:hypothetical protein
VAQERDLPLGVELVQTVTELCQRDVDRPVHASVPQLGGLPHVDQYELAVGDAG